MQHGAAGDAARHEHAGDVDGGYEVTTPSWRISSPIMPCFIIFQKRVLIPRLPACAWPLSLCHWKSQGIKICVCWNSVARIRLPGRAKKWYWDFASGNWQWYTSCLGGHINPPILHLIYLRSYGRDIGLWEWENRAWHKDLFQILQYSTKGSTA